MREVKAEILAIGDELLYGQIMDTNSLWISQQLTDIGVRVVHRATVGDNEPAILEAFKAAQQRADIVLITGGLGPTRDDLTKPLLAKYFDCDIQLVPEALEAVKSYFARRGRELTELNILQAHLPTKCTYVPNTMGTAPGMWFEENDTLWMSMPGVPHEMKKLMETFVFPQLKERFSLPVIYHKVVKTVGIGESWLADKIRDWEDALPSHIKLAYLPSIGLVRLRLTAFGEKIKELTVEVEEQIEKLLPLAGKYVYGFDETSLEDAVGQLLRSQNKTVALAESCTGGYISHLITSVAGSSAYFNGSIIPYHNQFKQQVLGVKKDTLIDHGAVSEETVIEMASAVRKTFGSDYGLASSGVAGPGGGSDEKPVGTVWIACASEDGVRTKKLQLTDDRMINIQLSGISVLNLLRLEINKITE
ncbi:competence/damage-inducible protein A [Litoribacter alkaliphilus]|uniref:CinA-like protein n=1 Tax=Litoribacter ruber TaxID=702568 RepID=A0AAP2CFM0_9BACT|nr:competence/damage-inducible protein A [Litoribacter alkaliphilus]MBS9523082.1 competence/damage-inducible protein A [Litoribacter alkaliphilus]